MSAAPDHTPTMSRAGVAQRLGPYLPVLLIPTLIPVLAAAVNGTTATLAGAPRSQPAR